MPDLRFEKTQGFSGAQIVAIELKIGRRLPDAFSHFLKEYGGAFVGGSIDGSHDFSVLAFFGPEPESGILSRIEAYPDLKEEGVLPIACCELGNIFVLDRQNAVYFINYYGGRTSASKVASSFEEFLARIVIDPE